MFFISRVSFHRERDIRRSTRFDKRSTNGSRTLAAFYRGTLGGGSVPSSFSGIGGSRLAIRYVADSRVNCNVRSTVYFTLRRPNRNRFLAHGESLTPRYPRRYRMEQVRTARHRSVRPPLPPFPDRNHRIFLLSSLSLSLSFSSRPDRQSPFFPFSRNFHFYLETRRPLVHTAIFVPSRAGNVFPSNF